MKENFTQLSKLVSHALRHAPSEYQLELDEEGWVSIKELICALQLKMPDWKNLCEQDLVEMIEKSLKQRHEIRSGKIRCLYGHSVAEKILKEPRVPPDILYHGTSPQAVEVICKEGLKAMKRHYVHLSVDKESAKQVGFRKSSQPILLSIRASEASKDQVNFYVGNEGVWLADFIPPNYIDITAY